MIPTRFGNPNTVKYAEAEESVHVPEAIIKMLIDDILSITSVDNNSHYPLCDKLMFHRIKDSGLVKNELI